MIYGEGNTVPVPSLDLLTFVFGETLHDLSNTICITLPITPLTHVPARNRLRTLHGKR